MRTLLGVFLGLLLTAPVYSAGSDDSGSSYNSQDRRIAKAGKYINAQEYKKAVKELRKALKKDDQNADAWNLLGFASRKMGDHDNSAVAYANALQLDPEHKGALEYQGELFITLGEIDQAKENLQKLVALCPSGCEERAELEQALAAIN
jgi:Tfp pilus assembly protein PilF